MKIAELRVTMIAHTIFTEPSHVPWTAQRPNSSLDVLAEFAGRACYQSWGRPNLKTATNDGYLRHILTVSHLSVLEHSSASFYIEGVSRSLTHELIRHRHFSYSQLSQRYVDLSDAAYVVPWEFKDDVELRESLETEMWNDEQTYQSWVDHIYNTKLSDMAPGLERRKRARQSARSVLANAVETKIVMTGNMRAWRHFVHMRASQAADPDIRALAVEILRQLRDVAPNTFQDFTIAKLPDGTEVAIATLGREAE